MFVPKLFPSFLDEPLRWHKLLGHSCRPLGPPITPFLANCRFGENRQLSWATRILQRSIADIGFWLGCIKRVQGEVQFAAQEIARNNSRATSTLEGFSHERELISLA